MHFCKTYTVYIYFILLFFILSGCGSFQEPIEVGFNSLSRKESIKIALIADTQVQTRKTAGFPNFWQNTISDNFIDVSLRPPAQNNLSIFSLKKITNKIIQNHSPEIIFYLGDGANNGCQDELEAVFSALKDFQDRGQPILYLVGNHDYLGAGNTSHPSEREKLCENPAKIELNRASNTEYDNIASKYELIKRIHEFNKGSAELMSEKGFRFEDNFTSNLKTQCRKGETAQHFNPECFYSAYLYNNKFEFILLDSSSYADKGTPGAGPLEFAGKEGSLCCSSQNEGQWAWLGEERDTGGTFKRTIFATHYSPNHLNLFKKPSGRSSREPRQVRNFLNKINNHNFIARQIFQIRKASNSSLVWISGHTHRQTFGGATQTQISLYELPPREAVGLARTVKTLDVVSYNVGSTTDYIQHGAIIKIATSSSASKEVRLVKEEEESICKTIKKKINNKKLHIENLYPINDYKNGLPIFGLTKHYRNWDGLQYKKALRNFSSLREHFKDNPVALKCLASLAAKKESKNGTPVDLENW